MTRNEETSGTFAFIVMELCSRGLVKNIKVGLPPLKFIKCKQMALVTYDWDENGMQPKIGSRPAKV